MAITYNLQLDDDPVITDITELTYTFTDLTASTEYSVKVQAEDDVNGPGEWSDPLLVSTLGLPPGKPTGLAASNVTATSFTISWTAPA